MSVVSALVQAFGGAFVQRSQHFLEVTMPLLQDPLLLVDFVRAIKGSADTLTQMLPAVVNPLLSHMGAEFDAVRPPAPSPETISLLVTYV